MGWSLKEKKKLRPFFSNFFFFVRPEGSHDCNHFGTTTPKYNILLNPYMRLYLTTFDCICSIDKKFIPLSISIQQIYAIESSFIPSPDTKTLSLALMAPSPKKINRKGVLLADVSPERPKGLRCIRSFALTSQACAVQDTRPVWKGRQLAVPLTATTLVAAGAGLPPRRWPCLDRRASGTKFSCHRNFNLGARLL